MLRASPLRILVPRPERLRDQDPGVHTRIGRVHMHAPESAAPPKTAAPAEHAASMHAATARRRQQAQSSFLKPRQAMRAELAALRATTAMSLFLSITCSVSTPARHHSMPACLAGRIIMMIYSEITHSKLQGHFHTDDSFIL